MHRIYIETTNGDGSKKTNEYRFFEHLIEKVLNKRAEIVGIKGKTNLDKFEQHFQDTTKRGFKNLVIIDADGGYNTAGWSFQSEFSKIQNRLNSLGVSCEIFFLPNHQHEGDFEVLLERIINPAHQRVIDCHQAFEDCVKQYGTYVTPNQKARIYSYVSSFPMTKSQEEDFKNKGDWFFSDSNIWDFNSPSLQPLKDFLNLHL